MKTLSWILVLLPYLMLFLSSGFAMDLIKKEGFEEKKVQCKTWQDCPNNADGEFCNTSTGFCEFHN